MSATSTTDSEPDWVPGRVVAADVLKRLWKVLIPAAAAFAAPLLVRHHHAKAMWPALIYLTCAGVLLAAIDLRYRRLPNILIHGTFMAALLLIPALSRHEVPAWTRAVEAGLAVGVAMMLLIPRRIISEGDSKLIGLLVMLPAWTSWMQILPALFVFFLPPALAGVALLVSGRAKRNDQLPYGPWLLLGAYLYLMLSAKAW